MAKFKCLNKKCGSKNTIEIGGVVDSSTTVRCKLCGQTSWYPVWYAPNKRIKPMGRGVPNLQ